MKLVCPILIGFSEFRSQLDRNASAVANPATATPDRDQDRQHDERDDRTAAAAANPLLATPAALQQPPQLVGTLLT